LFKNYYFAKIQKNNPTVSLLDLENSYQYCTIIRLLQVLGAYGFRGLVQKKAHFLSSIHLGQKNLKSLISDCEILNNYPYLKELIAYCSENLIEIPE